MAMARVQTLVQLDDAQLAALDQRAAQRSVSRSQLIREAIEAYVADDLEAAVSRQIIEGYERIPMSTPDEWGDPEEWMTRSADDLFAAVDEEERAAGQEPW